MPRISLSVTGVIAVLIALELILRLTTTSVFAYEFDPKVGEKGNEGARLIFTSEGGSQNTFGALGVIGKYDSSGSQQFRLLLGDSVTQALHVKTPQRFSSLLNAELEGPAFLNAGSAGTGIIGHLRRFDLISENVPVREVILVVTPTDIADLSGERYRYDADAGQLSLPDYHRSSTKELTRSIMQKSALATFLVQKYRPGLSRLGSELCSNDILRRAPSCAASASSKPPIDHFLAVAIAVVEDIQAKVPVTIVFFPEFIYGSESISSETENSALSRTLFLKIANETGATFCDLSQSLKDAAIEKTPVGFNNSFRHRGHLNAWGHEIVAKELKSNCLFRNQGQLD